MLSPFVLAEVDYLVLRRLGVPQELELLRQVAEGAWTLESFDADDVRVANGIVEAYADQRIGLAQASMVVLAQRHRTDRILTLDRRHFSVLRQSDGRPFTILPG